MDQLASSMSSLSVAATVPTVVSVGGGRKVILEDFCGVAVLSMQVAIDSASLERVDEDAKKCALLPVDVDLVDLQRTGGCTSSTAAAAETLCRAAIFAKIVTILHGRSGIRSRVVELLAAMLNKQVVPVLCSAETAGAHLVEAISGVGGSCFSPAGQIDTAQAFKNYGLEGIVLGEHEKASLAYGQFFATGTAALVVSGVFNTVAVSDVVAALTCEAAQITLEAFDSVHFDIYRQHRGQMASSANFRQMLEGSKRCSSSAKSLACPSILHSPQVHGPAIDTILYCKKSIELELTSSESGPARRPVDGLDPSQVMLAIENAQSVLSMMTQASVNRSKELSQSTASISTAEAFKSFDLLDPVGSIRRAASALISEVGLASLILDEAEAAVSKASHLAEETNTEEADGDTKSRDAGKKTVSEEGLSAEALARIEAKRKAKADKAAEKAKAKQLKKIGGTSLILGVGCSSFRSYLIQRNKNIHEMIDPFDVAETGFVVFCQKLLEALGSGGKRKPKIAKGARDFTPEQMRIREQVFSTIRRVFKRHGAVEIDTPVFELKEVLTGKYGEDSKLIYDLADQGGELLSLRYDLTVPFARFLAMNSVGNIKRYHIAKVYRRDNPQLTKGRYREFYQCDFDVAGSYTTMVPDAEVITVATEILSELPIGGFLVKLNHRRLLDAIFEISGVPPEKFRSICSAVDKLDKMSWEDVKSEMINEKGLPEESADKIGLYVRNSGQPMTLLKKLIDENTFGEHVGALTALGELKTLFSFLESMDSIQYLSFDLSLARGLDYYTGVIYEVVLTDGTSQMGSIAAGGRYDKLVGMFSASNQETPCVGVSIGVERVFTIMERKAESMGLMQMPNVQVFVAAIGGYLPERMKVARLLWSANISAEYSHQEDLKFKRQLDETLERGIPYMVVIGKDELSRGSVKVKDMKSHVEEEVPVDGLVTKLLSIGCLSLAVGTDTSFLEAMRQRA